MKDMLYYVSEEVKAHLINTAKDCETIMDFEIAIGWEDWMDGFTEAEDGEPCSAQEEDFINSILKCAFAEAHKELEKEVTPEEYELADIITRSPAWDGIKNPMDLARMHTKEELKDLYDQMHEAEEEYYENRNKAHKELKTERMQVKIEPTLKAMAQKKAAEQGRTLSNYICELIRRDN